VENSGLPDNDSGGMGETTVLIVDARRCFADLLSAALATVPGIRCLGTAASAAEGFDRPRSFPRRWWGWTSRCPCTDGLVATRRLREASPRTAVVVVTAHADGEWVARGAAAGASAFIPKAWLAGGDDPHVDGGEAGLDSRGGFAVGQGRGAARVDREVRQTFTMRELEVLAYIGQGLEAKSIARVMGISVHTCRGYIKAPSHAKLHVRSRIKALNRGQELQLLKA
jgi:DNA-binding NarL/FixJ family response regulator